MKVLMFGWEFPPHISGGLGTACYGLVKSLMEEHTDILFVVPRAHGDEAINLVNASDVILSANVEGLENNSVKVNKQGDRKFTEINVASSLSPYNSVELWKEKSGISQWNHEMPSTITKEVKVEGGKRYQFSGTYGASLLDEVQRYSEVAGEIASNNSFDVIHAHDWLTYQAGIAAKKVSGKPLVVHVHATEYDRAGEKNINTHVADIEREGMEAADKVIAVSQWTKDIIVDKYGIDEEKVSVVYNGVITEEAAELSSLPRISDKIVTFLGRITYQKGPEYFVEAARKVLQHYPDAHFIMAGSGDLLPDMIKMVASLKMSSRFHFTGFLKGKRVDQVWSVSDVYVMPSVSEPFGITPLEAIQAGVPVIVSNQSGVAEVMEHAVKVDFWDTDALANAIIHVFKHKRFATSLAANGKKELKKITWNRAAKKINNLYHELQPAC